jgi:hypothetical protein
MLLVYMDFLFLFFNMSPLHIISIFIQLHKFVVEHILSSFWVHYGFPWSVIFNCVYVNNMINMISMLNMCGSGRSSAYGVKDNIA